MLATLQQDWSIWGSCEAHTDSSSQGSFWIPAGSGTANPTSTSALCSCACSRVGQSKRVPTKASAFNLSAHRNHLNSSISTLRMGWTCWQILPEGIAELPEQLQLGDGALQSHHTTVGPPWWTEGCHAQAGRKRKFFLGFLLCSSANRSGTKTYISSFPFLVRGRNSPAEKLGLSLSFINNPTVAYGGPCLWRAGKRILDCIPLPYLLSQTHEAAVLFKHPRPKPHRHAQRNEGIRTTKAPQLQYWKLRSHSL